jgi:hypothetical protein
MRRFDQIIRYAGHFGKPGFDVNPNHQIGRVRAALESIAFQERRSSSEK